MQTFSKILVANRGEIAVRIIRTARKMGFRTVAVYSDADACALHVEYADEAVLVGAAPVSESYLNQDKILQAAMKTGAGAIHPGYGFLSENPEFARRCKAQGIVFIGPSPEAIELMGNKRLSKLAMMNEGIPCIEGYQGEQQSDDELVAQAERMGYPIMIKASAGGGGRGMRQVYSESDMCECLKMARSEALTAFGDDSLILEKSVVDARHIEIQVFADSHGNCVYMHERDCSVQRRHQKVVEEAPSPFVDQGLRKEMGEAAVKVAKSCNYIGAGTVEFLVDKDKRFYFLEMNTRLQVEHPVTEMITGLDLVAWQIKVAAGEALPLQQEDIPLSGHGIEVRLYAEDPSNNFLPQTGKVLSWDFEANNGIRVDSGIKSGSVVSPHYDPMLAKIVAWGESRSEACRKLLSCLEDIRLLGFKNNKGLLRTILTHDVFLNGQATTEFLERDVNIDTPNGPGTRLLVLATVLRHTQDSKHHSTRSGWRISSSAEKHYRWKCDSQVYDVSLVPEGKQFLVSVEQASELIELHDFGNDTCIYSHDGIRKKQHYVMAEQKIFLESPSGHFEFEDVSLVNQSALSEAESGEVLASMDGVIVDVMVKRGERVRKGDTLVILEAMKMEHPLKSVIDGIVEEVTIEPGKQVRVRQMLCKVVIE